MTIRMFWAGVVSLSLLISFAAAAQTPHTDDDEHHKLEELIVTATMLERTVEQLAQPTTVVDKDQLIKAQSTSIGETLAGLPGVSASYFGPVASRPIIRGQFGERVLVLTNALDSLDASALSEDHAVTLDSILAERVEIVRGPATLLYGSGAAGGIVNIVDSRIHETPLAEPVSGAISYSTNSVMQGRSAAAKFDIGSEAAVFHVDWFRRTNDAVEIPGFAESAILRAMEEEEEHGDEDEDHDHEGEEEEVFGEIENSDSTTVGAAAAFTLRHGDGYTGVSINRFDSNYGVPGGHHHHEEEGHDEDDSDHDHEEEEEEEEEIVRIDMQQVRYDLKGEQNFDGTFDRVRYRFARSNYEHTEFEGAEVGTVFDTRGTDARVELRHKPIGLFEGAIGVQYKDIDFDAIGDEAFVPASETEQLSVFGFEEIALRDGFVLQASARVESQDISVQDQPDYSGTAVGASVGAVWSFNDTTTLSANVALTERHPNSTELYALGPHVAVQRFEIGDATLDKEQSTNIDVTYRANFALAEINVTGFYNSVSDYIVLSPTADEEDGFQVFEYGQTDVDLYGYEAEALIDFFDDSRGHLHATIMSDFVFGEQSGDGAYVPRLPPLSAGFGLHYTRDNFEAEVEAIRYSEQKKTANNELPTDAYTMINFEASYRVAPQNVYVYLKGRNLGDEDARRHTSPLKDLAPLPGRSIQAGFRWDF